MFLWGFTRGPRARPETAVTSGCWWLHRGVDGDDRDEREMAEEGFSLRASWAFLECWRCNIKRQHKRGLVPAHTGAEKHACKGGSGLVVPAAVGAETEADRENFEDCRHLSDVR